MAETTRIALILGANGGIGSETARALSRHGWMIRALTRSGKPSNGGTSFEWIKGDAMDRDSIVRAAEGVDAIVHGVNPPGYRNWAKLVLPMIDNTIAAAKASGGRILLPGTIYNYGPDAFPVLREDSPQSATTHKGKIRTELERHLSEASQGGVRSLIVRFGDFFGPNAGGSWFSQALVKPKRPVSSVTYPGRKGVGHSWAYLPDTGEVFARLMDREAELEPFARFHFEGHYDPDGTQMISAIARAAGKPKLKVRGLPWFIFRVGGLVNETFREIAATRPLWRTSIRLDNRKLISFLGDEPRTPLDEAVRATLAALGCIEPGTAAPRSTARVEGA
jgi:nucleoside-diphosphate-sugar epimerase